MATIKISVSVSAAGNTPFTAGELAEVTSYLANMFRDIEGSISDVDFRVVGLTSSELAYSGVGSFL